MKENKWPREKGTLLNMHNMLCGSNAIVIFVLLYIKAATGDTGQEMEAAVVAVSNGENLTGAAMQLYTVDYMLTGLLIWKLVC